MTTIRSATPDDAEMLAELAERTFRDTFKGENTAADMDLHCERNFAAGIQRREILDPACLTLLAFVDDALAGFAQVRWESASDCVAAHRPAELYRIYVSSDWHGRGVAQAIMDEVIAAAVKAGSDALWLGVWERNPKATAFYRKYGFDVVGDQVFKLGNDPQRDLIMAMNLENRTN